MECSEPGAIRDEELLAYSAGERVRPAVAEHLTHCERCAAQLAAYQRMELRLSGKLHRWDCPSPQVLGEYQLGMLDQQQAAAINNHLRACMRCAAEVATLMEFLAHDPWLVEQAPAPQPHSVVQPSSLNNHISTQRVKQTLRQLGDQAHGEVRRIIATLLPAQPRLAYQRDAAQQTATWPRRYAAADLSISLQLESSPDRRNTLQLIGFVTRKGATLEALQGTPVQLSSSTHVVFTQQIDELGNFVFSALAPATYTLELHFADTIIFIDQLPVTVQD
jgi:anti-sigma factor RsiW